MVNIGVIGAGYVGLPTAASFAHYGHKVIVVDSNYEKIEMLKCGQVPIFEPGLEELIKRNESRLQYSHSIEEGVKNSQAIFVSVPTPPSEDGSADVSYVENVAEEIARHLNGEFKLIVEKSTVPVNTGNRIEDTIRKINPGAKNFDVVSNPEYLQEGVAIRDVLNPNRISIGINPGPHYFKSISLIKDIYSPFNSPKIFSDRASAELAKLAANAFLMQKISWINSMALLCRKTGGTVKSIVEHISHDERIGHHFLKAGIGFGGSCFGKDGKSLLYIAKQCGIPFKMLEDALEINDLLRGVVADDFSQYFSDVKGKRIGILGLAFKPNTDDIRDAPSIAIAKKLMVKGAIIQAHDMKANENARKEFSLNELKKQIEIFNDPYDALRDVHGILLATEWDEYLSLDYERIYGEIAFNGKPLFFDGRGVLSAENMRKIGYGFGRIDISQNETQSL